jgi:hypothetical protein
MRDAVGCEICVGFNMRAWVLLYRGVTAKNALEIKIPTEVFLIFIFKVKNSKFYFVAGIIFR